MAEPMAGRYWCHMCSQAVSPVMEAAELKCPYCDHGFVEEMDATDLNDAAADRALSVWAPILLGMIGSPARRRRHHRRSDDDDDDDDGRDRELDAILRRRRRSSALLQLLHALRERERSRLGSDEGESERAHANAIHSNALGHGLLISGSLDAGPSGGQDAGVSLGDYFLGPGMDLLLQHLAENDPSRHGTPPAKKEAVEAMPTVKVGEAVSCAVCLEDLAVGEGAKEMPCKHMFHAACILPWLDMHCSCPVCRFELPAEDTKNSSGRADADADADANGNASDRADMAIVADNAHGRRSEETEGSGGRRFSVPIPWPFNGLFSVSGSSSAPSGSGSQHYGG